MVDKPVSTTGPFPNYIITRRQDLSFQFNPPVGSLELANALAFKYPLEPDLESQLRRALLDHLGSENIIYSTAEQSPSEQRHLDILTLKATPANDVRDTAKKKGKLPPEILPSPRGRGRPLPTPSGEKFLKFENGVLVNTTVRRSSRYELFFSSE
jgi:hypothetical protein